MKSTANNALAAAFWLAQPDAVLIEAVGDNLRDFGNDEIGGIEI